MQEVFLRNNEVLIVIYLSLAVLKRRNRSREYFADTHGYSVKIDSFKSWMRKLIDSLLPPKVY